MFNYMGAIAGLLLLGSGTGSPLAGQVPPKPVTDTTVKKPAVSEQRMKIQKGLTAKVPEQTPVVTPGVTLDKPVAANLPAAKKGVKRQTAGGEVTLPPCPVDQDSVDRALAAVRQEDFAREQQALQDQRRLDSVSAEFRVRDAVDQARSLAAAARQREKLDSIAFAEKTREEAALALKRHLARGFYLGLAGGASAPQRDSRNGYTGGWNTTIPFGWDANNSPFGIRTDFSVDHLNGTRTQNQLAVTTAASGDITVWSLNADLKLRMHAPGTPTRSHVYVLGGAGAHRVSEGVYGTTGPLAGQKLNFSDAKTNFGWNVGAGASLEWGPTELFIESRFFQVKSNLTYHMNNGVGTYTSFTPIVVGFQFF
jgi:opacity protein-like surface antigen